MALNFPFKRSSSDLSDKSATLSEVGPSGLSYSFVGYSTDKGKESFEDNGDSHSPIIGWAYDGNPIYGPYGYSDAMDQNSKIIILTPGYVKNVGIVSDRPIGFNEGFFTEDYSFDSYCL